MLPTNYKLTNHISLMGRVFANGPGDSGSIPGRVIPKTFKMVLDTSLLNTQQYKVRNKGKVPHAHTHTHTHTHTHINIYIIFIIKLR